MKTHAVTPRHSLARALPTLVSVAAVAAALWALPGNARASIGVDFGTMELAPTDQAGVTGFAQTHYNIVSAAATGLVLNDNTGTATTAKLTTTGADSFSAITGLVASPDEALNDARANSSAATWSFSVVNIPYASYSVIVYDLQFGAGTELGIGIGTTTLYTSSPDYAAAGYLDDNAATPYIYTQGVSTVSTAPTALGDYVLFTGLTGASQTVTMTGFGGGERIGGFQIVPNAVPEPSTWALMLGGLGLLVGARRFRRVSRA